MTVEDTPLKVAVADVKLLAVAVIVTSVPTGPEVGVIVFDTTPQSPVPSITNV